MFGRRRRWEVGGVRGERDDDGWSHYTGAAFAAAPEVRDALAEAPETFADLEDPSAAPVPRERFLGSVGFATRDGRSWEVGLDDDHAGALPDLGDDPSGDDLVTDLLREGPAVSDVVHPDREVYELTTHGRVPASQVVAGVYRALARAHRRLADG